MLSNGHASVAPGATKDGPRRGSFPTRSSRMTAQRWHALRAMALACLAVIGNLAAHPARAAFTFTFTETGGDVVGIGSGVLWVGQMPIVESGPNDFPYLDPEDGSIVAGARNDPISIYSDASVSGPTRFGPNRPLQFPSTTGAAVAIYQSVGPGGFQGIQVPFDYVPGAPLAATMTFVGATFASLYITPGTYTWGFDGGPVGWDTFTLQFVPRAAEVPEPASILMLAAGLFGIAAARRRRWLAGIDREEDRQQTLAPHARQ